MVSAGLVHPPLTGRWRGRLGRLAALAADTVAGTVPAYGRLPEPERNKLRTDIADVVEWLLAAVDGADPDPAELRSMLWDTAARRARQGISLDDLNASWDLPYIVCARDLFDLAEPRDQPDVARILDFAARYSGREVSREAYYTELRRLGGGAARAEALLGGAELDPPTDRPAGGFWVLVVRPPDGLPAVWTPPALPLTSATCVRDGAVVVLVPDGSVGPRCRAVVDEVFRTVGGLFPGSSAGLEHAASADEVPAAHRNAATAARLTSPLARQPRSVSDVIVDIAVGADRSALAAVLRPLVALDEHPDLLVTLEMFYETDMDRGAVAQALSLHRNTVDYRLARIEKLTGIDPRTVRGVRLLTAGLAARRIDP